MRNNAPLVAQDKILYSVPMLQKRHGTARTAETSGTHNDCHDNALSSAGIAGTRHSRYHDFGTLLNVLCMYDADMDLHECVSPYLHNPYVLCTTFNVINTTFYVVHTLTYIFPPHKNASNAEFINI